MRLDSQNSITTICVSRQYPDFAAATSEMATQVVDGLDWTAIHVSWIKIRNDVHDSHSVIPSSSYRLPLKCFKQPGDLHKRTSVNVQARHICGFGLNSSVLLAAGGSAKSQIPERLTCHGTTAAPAADDNALVCLCCQAVRDLAFHFCEGPPLLALHEIRRLEQQKRTHD